MDDFAILLTDEEINAALEAAYQADEPQRTAEMEAQVIDATYAETWSGYVPVAFRGVTPQGVSLERVVAQLYP